MASLIGHHLRSAREKRGLSLLDASYETRIPVQRLHWLEQDNYAAFGNLTYARAFLKIYSAYLDVSAGEMLETLPSPRLGGPTYYRYLTTNHGPWVISDRKLAQHLARLGKKKSLRSPMHGGIAIFVLMLIGTGIWGHHVSTGQIKASAELPYIGVSTLKNPSISTKSEVVSAQIKPAPQQAQARAVRHPKPAFKAGIPGSMQ